MRVLGAVRQSKTTTKLKGKAVDPVSPATQRKRIKAWADANDAHVVKITEDLSRSGGTSAFKRPKLGPWLTDLEHIAAWDVLVTLKLDRACRDTADYLALRKWAKDHGKRIVFLNNPELDESTPAGKAMGSMTAVFAEFERDMACERNTERYWGMVEDGKWPGGRIPYGWREENGILVPDKGGKLEILNEMADKAIAGKSNGQIRKWLNDNGHLTMLGKEWRINVVRDVLWANKTMELLGETKAAQLRAALRSRTQTRGERVGGHMLLRVAYCRICKSPLYAGVKRDWVHRGHYRCLECVIYIRMDELEDFVESKLLEAVGERKLTRRQLVPGDDHQAAIHALEADIEKLSAISGTELVIESKRAEIDTLKAMPYEPDRYERVQLDITVAEHWATLDNEGRGSFLRNWGVKVHADRDGAKLALGWLIADEPDTFPLD